MTSHNKDYSWQWLDKLLDEFGLKYEWPFGYMHDKERTPADQRHEARTELRAEALVAIQHHINEHYIGKGDRRSDRCPHCRVIALDNNQLEHHIAAKHPFAKLYAESEVEQREALLKSDLAWCLGKLRGLGHPAEKIEARHQLSTNNKDTLERSSNDKN